MTQAIDLTGQKYGRLTVLERAPSRHGHTMWLCRCDCGKETVVGTEVLRRGKSRSCGCLRKELLTIDLTGQRFGRLVVVERAGNKWGTAAWLCVCDCGNNIIASSNALRKGHTKSCGCLSKETIIATVQKYVVKHKMSKHRLYRIWNGMRDRCNNKKYRSYKNYGGRGIRVCEEWDKDFISFRDWALSNGYRDNLTIDRIHNNGDYKPDNCRWVTLETQANNRRSNRLIAFGGEVYTLAEWAKLLGVRKATLFSRLKKSTSVEDAFVM